MFRRAKIGAVLMLAGSLTGGAAPLNVQQKNPPSARERLIAPAVLKPAEAKASLGTASRWPGVKVQQIIRRPQAASSAEVNGFSLAKGAEAARQPASLAPAVAAVKE
jgi:hypothetical protein